MGGEKWHYLTVKIMSRSLHSITSNYNDDSYCMNCLLSCRTRNKLKLHENVSKNQNHCNKCLRLAIKYLSLSRIINLLRFYSSYMQTYECFLQKESSCDNDPAKSFTLKANKDTACGYLLYPYLSSDDNKNKHDSHRGEDFVKKSYANLKEHARKIIHYEKGNVAFDKER